MNGEQVRARLEARILYWRGVARGAASRGRVEAERSAMEKVDALLDRWAEINV